MTYLIWDFSKSYTLFFLKGKFMKIKILLSEDDG